MLQFAPDPLDNYKCCSSLLIHSILQVLQFAPDPLDTTSVAVRSWSTRYYKCCSSPLIRSILQVLQFAPDPLDNYKICSSPLIHSITTTVAVRSWCTHHDSFWYRASQSALVISDMTVCFNIGHGTLVRYRTWQSGLISDMTVWFDIGHDGLVWYRTWQSALISDMTVCFNVGHDSLLWFGEASWERGTSAHVTPIPMKNYQGNNRW